MPHTLNRWVDFISEAERECEAADLSRRQVRQRRATTLRGRLTTWLGAMRGPGPLCPAAERLKQVRADALFEAEEWVQKRAAIALGSSGEASHAHALQALQRDTCLADLDRIRRVRALAEKAMKTLSFAEKTCSEAGRERFTALLGQNQALAMLSYNKVVKAKAALKTAQGDLAEVWVAMPKKGPWATWIIYDEILGLAFDFATSPYFELLSQDQHDQMAEAARQCAEGLKNLSVMLDRIKEAEVSGGDDLRREEEALFEIEKPFLMAAADLVPAEIGMGPPKGLGVPSA